MQRDQVTATGASGLKPPLRARPEVLITSPDPVWLIGVDGLVAWVNPAVEHVLGYARDQLKGMSLFAVIHPDDQETLAEQTDRLLATSSPGIREAFRLRYRHASGHWVSLEAERETVPAGVERSSSANLASTPVVPDAVTDRPT